MKQRLKDVCIWCTTPNSYRPYQWRYYRLPLLIFIADIVLVSMFVSIFSYVDVLEEVEDSGVEIASWLFILTILLVSVFEELLFRILPLGLALKFYPRPGFLLGVAFVSAAIFGYVHGGMYNIFLQGTGGFLYAILFIKYAAQGQRLAEASILLIVIHTMFNGLLGLLLLWSGETMF